MESAEHIFFMCLIGFPSIHRPHTASDQVAQPECLSAPYVRSFRVGKLMSGALVLFLLSFSFYFAELKLHKKGG